MTKVAHKRDPLADAADVIVDRVVALAENPTLAAELKETFREGAIEVLKPVLRKATKTAALYAVVQGPSLVKERVAPRVIAAGGVSAIAKAAASKSRGLVPKRTSSRRTARRRRVPIQECVDVGLDIETAYDEFTVFEDRPRFMDRVVPIDELVYERIAWRSAGGPHTIGVATFHTLSDRLTRIYVTLDVQPQGLFEAASSGLRVSHRALRSELTRFKAFAELASEEVEEPEPARR